MTVEVANVLAEAAEVVAVILAVGYVVGSFFRGGGDC